MKKQRSKRQGRARGGRVAIANMGAAHKATSDTKWHHKMQREHPLEYAEAMRRIEEVERK